MSQQQRDQLDAAAPDLLAALKAMVEWVAFEPLDSGHPVARARAAIAKAEGHS